MFYVFIQAFLHSCSTILHILDMVNGLPMWHSSKESTCQCRRCKRCGFDPRVKKIPWSRKWQPAPLCLPRQFHGQRSPMSYSPRGQKRVGHSELLSVHTHTDTHTHTHTHLVKTGCFSEQHVTLALPSLRSVNHSLCYNLKTFTYFISNYFIY